MPDKLKKQERQMTRRESDDRIVPLQLADRAGGSKPGNAGAGKAVRPSHDSTDTPPTPSGGSSVLDRLDRITQRAQTHPEEVFNNLFSLLTYELLWLAFGRLKRDKAPDNVCHERLVELLEQRISDPRMLALIGRFLKAGVMIAGQRRDTEEGVPQGSVLSPLLANVYLHYVLDEWFERDVQPRLSGEAYIIRYADDFICAFENESDARRFQEVLPKRLARYSLELAEEKTQLLRFGRFARGACQRQGEGAPRTFDFLGFTHYCGTSRAGKFKLKRRTAKKKFKAKVRDLKNGFHLHLTTPLREVWKALNAKLRGHYQYYGINDNWPWLMKFRGLAKRLAFRWLNRRSQSTSKTWQEFYAYVDRHGLANPKKLTDLIAMARSVR